MQEILNLQAATCPNCDTFQLMATDQLLCVRCRDSAIDHCNQEIMKQPTDLWARLATIMEAL